MRSSTSLKCFSKTRELEEILGKKIVKIQVFSESNRLYVDVFWVFVIDLRYIL